MTRRKTPWQLLGVKRSATEREIKSAYARKLKVTRPEDDAEAFQRLVEARDAALAYACAEIGADEELLVEEISPPPDPNPDASAGTNISHATALQEPDPQPKAHESTPPTSNDTFNAVVDRINGWLASENDGTSFDEIDRQVQLISELSLAAREDAERNFLFTLHTRIEQEENPSFDSGTKYLVELLDEEFGWTRNDRRVVEILGYEATAVVDRLQYIRHPAAIFSGQTEKPNYWGFLIWLVFISIFLFGPMLQRALMR
jgi:hypothetical protein